METVLVTGANGGLGFALSKALLEQGYFVILHYHKNKKQVELLHQAYPHTSFLISCDFQEEKQINEMTAKIAQKKYVVKYLINNAGIDHVSDLEEKNEATFLDVFKVNTVAPFLFMKFYAKQIDQLKGSIINISSDNAIDQSDMVTLEYDISKKGLNHLTEMFSKEYPNAKINGLCFGWLDTPMNHIPQEIKQKLKFVSLQKAVEEILQLMNAEETGMIKIVREI